MASTQQFPHLPQSTWTCWDTHLVPTLQEQACDSVQFSGGNSGTLSFHHKVPFSGGQFAFTYSYDPSGQVLSLTITDKPDIVSSSTIFGFVKHMIYTCPQ